MVDTALNLDWGKLGSDASFAKKHTRMLQRLISNQGVMLYE